MDKWGGLLVLLGLALALVFLTSCATVVRLTPQPFLSLDAIDPDTVQNNAVMACPGSDKPILVLFIQQSGASEGWGLFFTDTLIIVGHYVSTATGTQPDHLWYGTLAPDRTIHMVREGPMPVDPQGPCDYLTRAGA